METLQVVDRIYELYKHTVDINNHVDKRWRFSLGESLEKSILDCFSEVIMAKNAPKPMKMAYLLRANSHLEISRLKLRLFLELSIANETKIFQAQSSVSEIGRMLGGWIRSLSSNT